MSDAVLAPSLDYKPATYRHGSKVYTRLFQQTGGQEFKIPATSTVESIFEIPQKAFYLADSFIRGIATPTASAHYNWFHAKHHLVSEIHLYTRGGKYLAQIQNLPNYMEMTQDMNTSLTDFLGADEQDRYRPSRKAGDTLIAGGRAVGAVITADAPYTEPMYIEAGGDTTATPVLTFTFHLGAIKDTIFALKKALLLPETLLMRIVWGPGQRFLFLTTANNSMTTAAVPTGDINVTDMHLFLAVEEDPMVINDLRLTTATGYQLPIPYVSVRKYPDAGASQAKSVTVKITPDMGFAVKRLVYAPFNTTETKNVAFDHDNRDGDKIEIYNTSLDSLNRQQYPIDCSMYDDWNMHKWLFAKTPIQNRDIYQYNWVHVEDFSDLSIERKGELRQQVNPDNIVSGMPIVQNGLTERIWNIAINNVNTAANTLNHYVCIIGYKTFVVAGGAIDVLSMPPASV